MLTVEQSMCCKELEQLQGNSKNMKRVYPGFEQVCSNVHVLQTAFLQYKQEYKTLQKTMHDKNRYIAYRQFVR